MMLTVVISHQGCYQQINSVTRTKSCAGTRAAGRCSSPLREGAGQQRWWKSTGSWSYNPARCSAAPHPVMQQRGNLSSPSLLPELPFRVLFLPTPCRFCNVACKIKNVGWASTQPPPRFELLIILLILSLALRCSEHT